MKDIWSLYDPIKQNFFLGTFCEHLGIFCGFSPWALAEIITFASEHKNGEPILYVWHLFFCSLFCSSFCLLSMGKKCFVYQVAENTNIDVQNTTIKQLHLVDLDWFEKETSGSKDLEYGKQDKSRIRLFSVYWSHYWIEILSDSLHTFYILPFYLSLSPALFLSYYFLSRFLVRKAVQQSHAVNIEWENYR